MSDRVNKSKSAEKPALRDRKRRSWLRILLWTMLFVVIVFAIIAIYLWLNRYSLIEKQAQNRLSEAGIEAEFEIESIDRTRAILKNMSFADEDGPFFSADRLDVVYTLEKLRAGELDKITLKKPVLRLTLDGSGNVIDRWVPEASEDSEPITVPRDGIHIENGLLNWAAPWGAGATGISANIQSETSWQSQIDMKSARYSQNNVDFDYSFNGNINRMSELELHVDGKIGLPSARAKELSVGPVQSDFDLNLISSQNGETVKMTGKVDTALTQLRSPDLAMGSGDLGLDINAQYSFENSEIEKLEADWKFDGDKLSLADPKMRARLVERTMSYNALSKTPIAMHFSDYFLNNGKDLLKEFSANGSGIYNHSPSGYRLDLDQPMTLQADGQKITLIPGTPAEVSYNADLSKVDIDLDVDWEGRRSLLLKNLNLIAQSDNGLLLTGVDQVSTNISSGQEWRRTIGNEAYRLAPINIALNYLNSGSGSIVKLSGDVDYDGVLPGGRADNLKASGDIAVKTNGSKFALSFTPDQSVKVSEFVTSTGWKAQEIEFDIVDGDDVLKRSSGAQPFDVGLKNVRARIVSPEDDRHMAAEFDNLRVLSDFQTKPQTWNMDVGGIRMSSEDFPSPGTRIQSDAGTAIVTQYDTGVIEFAVESPVTNIQTDNVDVADLFIEMNGRPDDFSANYKAGKVQLKGGEIPEVPMEGTARLQNGVLSGSAIAPMPRTENTPINIEYRSEEGIGSAHISIPKVVFTPRGLQPQYLIPTLRGKLAEVSGEASAEFDFAFGGGGAVQSTGTTTLYNMDIGTLVGPASGVSAELTFKSMFPLETDGVQTATLAGFDAGFPLEDGTVKFEIVPDGIRIDEALWPVKSEAHGDGKIYISPLLWRFGNVENQAVVNVENLSLGELLKDIGKGTLRATGQISGQLPASIKGVDVRIHDGVLAVKNGGVIQYKNQGIDTFAKDSKKPFYLGDDFKGSETGFAFEALKNFEYKELEARIDGPLDGEMSLRMAFEGKNPDILAGTAFEFNIEVSGELANIARNSIGAFDAQKHLDRVLAVTEESGDDSIK